MTCTFDPTPSSGQTSCANAAATVPIEDGSAVSLAVGNPGNPATEGDFSIEWSVDYVRR